MRNDEGRGWRKESGARALGSLPSSILRLSAIIPSITTGGGLSLVLILDSTATTPRMVGNQSRPSRPFQPAGLATPLHWTLTRPSALPKAVLVMALIFL